MKKKTRRVCVSVPYFHQAFIDVPVKATKKQILKIFHEEGDTEIGDYDDSQAEIFEQEE